MQKLLKFKWLFVAIMLLGLSGCSSGGGSDNESLSVAPDDNSIVIITQTTGVSGTITDMAGNTLENVRIFSGSNETITDKDGEYSLSTSEGNISISAELTNYVQNSRNVTVTNGELIEQDIKLSSVDVIFSFDASSGASIKAKDATIDLPTSYTLDDGSTYTGTVTAKATYNKVTTATGKEAFPGEFLGEESGSGDTKVLQSYGFINVTLQSSDGKNLNIANNSVATLTYPMDTNIEDTPATIPLWYFDTTKGIWVEEGEATYDAATNSYSGTVQHFSTWNLDRKMDGATLNGCVEDSTGQKVPSDLYLSTAGWSKSISNNDVSGEFELINAPTDMILSIIAKVDGISSNEQNITLAAGEVRTLDSCLVLDQNASELFTTVKGKLVDINNNAVSNEYVYISSIIDNVSNQFDYSSTNSNGEFEFSFKRSNIENIKITSSLWMESQNIEFANQYEIDPTQDITDIGTIVRAVSSVRACVTLQDGSSTTDQNITTLADGITIIENVTVLDDGFTIFTIDERILAESTPYNASYYGGSFEEDGTFTYYVRLDNLSHSFYAHIYNTDDKTYTLTGKIDVLVNNSSIDLTQNSSECIQLDAMDTINQSASASISTTNSDVHLEVTYSKNSLSFHGDAYLIGENGEARVTTGSFDITKNGIYSIKQVSNSFDNLEFEGTMTLIVDGETYTLTIPDNSSSSEWWTAFNIEVYDGEITVSEENQAW